MRARTSASQARGSTLLSFADHRVHEGGALGAELRIGDQPGFPAQSQSTQRPLGGVVGQAYPLLVGEACEGQPAAEHVIDGFGTGHVTREFCALGAQPYPQRGEERRRGLMPHAQSLHGARAVNVALDGEGRLDARHRFERDGRDRWRVFAPPGAGGDVGQLEELALRIAGAKRFDDVPRLPLGRTEAVVAAEGVGLEQAVPVLAGPPAREVLARVAPGDGASFRPRLALSAGSAVS